jgi:hypothetical protein
VAPADPSGIAAAIEKSVLNVAREAATAYDRQTHHRGTPRSAAAKAFALVET